MAAPAVFVAPSQGDHAWLFEEVAKHLLKKVYNNQGWVFKTIVRESGNVAVNLVTPTRGSTTIDFWGQILASYTFVTVSHCGAVDGPILAHNHPTLMTTDQRQPWHLDPTQRELADRGKSFWGRVGKALGTSGKILILGCTSGNTYAPIVARAAQCTTFGFLDSCAAANSDSMERVVRAIETRGSSPRVEGFTP